MNLKQTYPHLARRLECGHFVPVFKPKFRLELLGVWRCSQCVTSCGDMQDWYDERADDEERRQSR